MATVIGLGKTIYAPFAFLFPLDAIVLVLFPGVVVAGWAAIKASVKPSSRQRPDWRLFMLHITMLHITLGGFAVLLVGAVVTGATHYLERYMHPFFLLTPLWLLWLVEEGGNAARRFAILGAALAAVTLLAVPLRLYDLVHGRGEECRKCRIAVPYEGLAAALKARGFESGTLIAPATTPANLRRMFPPRGSYGWSDPITHHPSVPPIHRPSWRWCGDAAQTCLTRPKRSLTGWPVASPSRPNA